MCPSAHVRGKGNGRLRVFAPLCGQTPKSSSRHANGPVFFCAVCLECCRGFARGSSCAVRSPEKACRLSDCVIPTRDASGAIPACSELGLLPRSVRTGENRTGEKIKLFLEVFLFSERRQVDNCCLQKRNLREVSFLQSESSTPCRKVLSLASAACITIANSMFLWRFCLRGAVGMAARFRNRPCGEGRCG